MGPPHEGSIRRPIAPWANALTTELHLAPCSSLDKIIKIFSFNEKYFTSSNDIAPLIDVPFFHFFSQTCWVTILHKYSVGSCTDSCVFHHDGHTRNTQIYRLHIDVGSHSQRHLLSFPKYHGLRADGIYITGHPQVGTCLVLLPIWAERCGWIYFLSFSLGKDRSYLFPADVMTLGDIIGFHVFIFYLFVLFLFF